ncbi:hypothetical protein [Paeniglutamicibacter terrestris]|uniref:Uncharacterized protein n=1 Tax=Paeniglutamicibacter terrestris TaxID=2723403 RepID=A0ABX1G7B7_9MICC|nr:hypothetical protein [Paeniglutamicibacter terrestris]NKG22162.1 hypothetical protein [Paeniglutamicibacter terrestris]
MASNGSGFFARFFKRREQPTTVQQEVSAQGNYNRAAGPEGDTEEVLNTPVRDTAEMPVPDQESDVSPEAVEVPLGGGTPETPTPEVPTSGDAVPAAAPAPDSAEDLESIADAADPTNAATDTDTDTDTEESKNATGITDSAQDVEPETTSAPASASDGTESKIAPEMTSTPEIDPAPKDDATTGTPVSVPDNATASEDNPETAAPDPIADTASAANARIPAPAGAPELRVVTIVSLAEHAGAATVAAALGNRSEAKRWQIRATGPGLSRAAFSGMLTDTDALVLVSPADPSSTSALDEKLRWLIANNRPALPGRTIFVINLGSAHDAGLQLPADLENPVVLLPLDPALALPALTPRAPRRAPRRAARRAIDQLVEEISSILEEQS